jgi:hypothetical protein
MTDVVMQWQAYIEQQAVPFVVQHWLFFVLGWAAIAILSTFSEASKGGPRRRP